MLAGCLHVFVDVGSNVGVQLTHLYEGSHGSKVARAFRRWFGPTAERLSSTCAVLIEPNPHHEAALLRLCQKFEARGARAALLCRAASNYDGNASFYIAPAAPQYHEWGSALLDRTKGATRVEVQTIDLARWLRQTVLARAGAGRGAVVMKLDVNWH
jgi:hypothetical protein